MNSWSIFLNKLNFLYFP
ncbi:hypothetical protein Golob_011844, partial [Gossypium lobatum]|nr:hypothetical protein [Gossypium lobatum]